MTTSKKNILVVTGTRAEYGLLKSTILKLRKSKILNVKLLVTGIHTLKKYGLTANEIKKDMPIDYTVFIDEKDDMIAALIKEITGIKKYVQGKNIDAILVIGDRDEAFAAAIVGIHLNIPLVHISGGDISGPTVDHYLRNAITVFSKLHLVQTKKSKQNVIRLTTDERQTRIIGSAGLDGLKPSLLISKKEISHYLNLNMKRKWLLALHHPTPFEDTSIKSQIQSVLQALKKIKSQDEKIILYPNTDTGSHIFIQAIKSLTPRKDFHIFSHLGRAKYLSLLYHCNVLIGNSSSGLMEAGFLKKPFVNVGNRQKNREHGINVIAVFYNTQLIIKAIQTALSKKFQEKLKKSKSIYRGGNVSGRIVNYIENFIKKIN